MKMAIRTATPELHKRITAAAATIGRGVRYNNEDMENEGRRESALAHIENQILLGRKYLTSQDIANLARTMHELDISEIPDDLSELDVDGADDIAHYEEDLDEEMEWEGDEV